MEQKIKKFLEFNGKVLYFVAHDGTYWVAIRPICEALGIEYINEYKRLKRHRILGTNVANMAMMDAQNRLFKMVSLPEKYIYGWLFSLDSGKAPLQEYQLKCYDLLYEYFHGSITGRHQALLEKSDALGEMEGIMSELSTDPNYLRLNKARAKFLLASKKLKELDDDFIQGQLTLNFPQSN